METMIEVRDLTKYYGPLLAVEHLDFRGGWERSWGSKYPSLGMAIAAGLLQS